MFIRTNPNTDIPHSPEDYAPYLISGVKQTKTANRNSMLLEKYHTTSLIP